jgi:hypothetical protein
VINVLLLIVITATFMFLFLTGALSVIIIVWGGLCYATSGGDSGKISHAKNTILYGAFGAMIAAYNYIMVDIGGTLVTGVLFGVWGLVGLVAFSLRANSRLFRWIALFSALWMPEVSRTDHFNDVWFALRQAAPLLRARYTVGLLVSSPLSGLRARRAHVRRTAEVAAELRRMA